MFSIHRQLKKLEAVVIRVLMLRNGNADKALSLTVGTTGIRPEVQLQRSFWDKTHRDITQNAELGGTLHCTA